MIRLLIFLSLIFSIFAIMEASSKIYINSKIIQINKLVTSNKQRNDGTKSDPEIINYVKKKYEKTISNIQHLYFPSKNPKKLYVIFNDATKDKYTMWSWFWDEKENWQDVAVLFLKDDEFSWYLGAEEKQLQQDYLNIIKHYQDKLNLKSNQLFTVGGSMGGYAALLYGILLEVKAVFAFKPQIDFESALLSFQVKNLKNIWIDINSIVKDKNYIPRVYLSFGDFLPDKNAALNFIENIKNKNTILVVNKNPNKGHLGFNPTKKLLLETLNYLENA